jgi:hypothetical protein
LIADYNRDFFPHEDEGEDEVAVDDNESPTAAGSNTPSDWLNPNQVILRLKLMKAEVLEQYGLFTSLMASGKK